ncbi:hypothetical protein HY500_02150 [Candidatus Woesearchaeota archaeon]|nr:hypothetical protein [Candidatus Woesearchaeota archaeon]
MDEKQQKRAGILIIILIGLLVVFAVFVSFFQDNWGFLTGKHVYESPSGEKFIFIENRVNNNLVLYELQLFTSKVRGVEHVYQIPLRNLPKEVTFVSFEEGIQKKVLNSRGVFITLDPKLNAQASLGAIEIAGVIGTADFGVFKIPTQGAFTEKTDVDYPVKTCEQAKDGIAVILLKLENENKVYSQGDCVVVEGDSYDNLIKSSERLIFGLFDIL